MSGWIDETAYDEYNSEFKQNFKEKLHRIRQRPATERSCTDIGCCIFFFIAFTAFVGYAGYSINAMMEIGTFDFPSSLTGTILQGTTFDQLGSYVIIILSCVGASIIISVIFCALLCLWAETVVLVMAFSGVVGIFATGIYLVTLDYAAAQSCQYFFFIGIIYAIAVCALFDDLRKAAILMKTVAHFIQQNIKILFVVVISLVYCLVVVALWMLGFYSFCMLYAHGSLSQGGFVGSSVFWAFMLLFFNFYFYYTSVYLTAEAFAIWFYQKQNAEIVGTSFKHMGYHLGTITFASLSLTLVTILRIFIQIARCRDVEGIYGCIGMIFYCMVCCVVSAMEVFVRLLNSYAIIVCALTGEGFVDSAKIVGRIAFDDDEAFSTFAITGYIIRSGAVICTSSIPSIIAAILINSYMQNTYLITVGCLLVWFNCSIVGMTILQIFIQSINTLFILYRLDTLLSDEGVQVEWVEEYAKQLDKSFDDAFIGTIKRKPQNIKYRPVTTVVIHQDGRYEVHQQQVPTQMRPHNITLAELN